MPSPTKPSGGNLPFFVVSDEDISYLREKYSLKCLLHFETSNPITCICGRSVEKKAFLFLRMNRTDPADRATFPVGERCAKKIANQLGAALPPLYYGKTLPKHAVSLQRYYSFYRNQGWDFFNLELYRAMQFIVSFSEWIPSAASSAAKNLSFIASAPGKESQPFVALHINDLVTKILKNFCTLTEACEYYLDTESTLRPDMCFKTCHKVLSNHDIVNRL